jgi:hypothetical protein
MTVPTELVDYFKKTGLPEAAYAPIVNKVEEYLSLVTESNKLVAQINAAKAQDPNNVDYLDTLWKQHEAAGDKLVSTKAKRFYKVAEEYERLVSELREIAKENFIPEQLNEEDTKTAKKNVNEMAPTIAVTKVALGEMFAIPESVLSLSGNVELPEGGLISLLPNAESLKNVRGRKAATASGEVKSYKTRIGEGFVDGESTNRDGKGRLDYVAESINEKWNAGPANKVTGEELEEAMFAAIGKDFRSVKSTELDDTIEFDFEKVLQIQNPNDDSFTEVPRKVRVTIHSVNVKRNQETADQPNEEAATEK